MNLWLIGMMGSGKSAVGKAVAARLGLDFVDTDAVVSKRTGCSIAQLWGEQGEAAFRALESAAVRDAAERNDQVVATGGGAILDPSNVEAMRASGLVVWLDAEPAVLAARVGRNRHRPLLADAGMSEERLAEILSSRLDRYAAASHHWVGTTNTDVDAVAERIEELWNESG